MWIRDRAGGKENKQHRDPDRVHQNLQKLTGNVEITPRESSPISFNPKWSQHYLIKTSTRADTSRLLMDFFQQLSYHLLSREKTERIQKQAAFNYKLASIN